jgi:hypothetical protein
MMEQGLMMRSFHQGVAVGACSTRGGYHSFGWVFRTAAQPCSDVPSAALHTG